MNTEKCGKCSSQSTTIQRLKGIAFDMHEQVIYLRKSNAAMAMELDTLKKQKDRVIDVENKHVASTNEAVVKAVGGVVVRYEKRLSGMEKTMEFYKGEMVRASDSLERLRSFCRNLPEELRLQVITSYRADKNTREQKQQFKNEQAEAYAQAQRYNQYQAKVQSRMVRPDGESSRMNDFSKRVSEAAARLRRDIESSDIKRKSTEQELENNKRART